MKKNNIYNNTCKDCNSNFIGKTPHTTRCSKCLEIKWKCKRCGKKKHTFNKTFCCQSCASKYYFENNEKVKNGLKLGAIACKGKPNYNIRGDKHHFWKGGTNDERYSIINNLNKKIGQISLPYLLNYKLTIKLSC
jgi:hypothetical protein